VLLAFCAEKYNRRAIEVATTEAVVMIMGHPDFPYVPRGVAETMEALEAGGMRNQDVDIVLQNVYGLSKHNQVDGETVGSK